MNWLTLEKVAHNLLWVSQFIVMCLALRAKLNW